MPSETFSIASTNAFSPTSSRVRNESRPVSVGGSVHEGEGRIHPWQRPERDAPDRAAFYFGDEAPLRAHRVGGKHAFHVLLDLFSVVGRSGGFDEVVEPVGSYGTYAHLCSPPAAVWGGGKPWVLRRAV
jgi:hypothetical protein